MAIYWAYWLSRGSEALVLQALRQVGVEQIRWLAPGCVSFAAAPEKVRELQSRMEGIASVIVVDKRDALVCDLNG